MGNGSTLSVSVSVGSAYYDGSNWDDVVEYVRAADRLGCHTAWSAEAWGMESVASLGYLAAVTEQIHLDTGIMQICARTPAMTALTALSLAQVSGDRFRLGLGVSGPQVVEGLHGQEFARPLSRLREYIDVVRMTLRGERVRYSGEFYDLPRRGGEGKALRSSIPPKPDLPIYLATLGPRMLEFTGEVADGWLGTSFVPEHADVLLDPIRAGAERTGRSLDDIDLQVNAQPAISDDVDRLLDRARGGMAFTLGAMGSATTNFYNAAYARAGFGEVAAEVQRRWVEGDREGATQAVPDEMLLLAYPIGTEQMVRDRLAAYVAAGIKGIRVGPSGRTVADQIEHLEQTVDLARSIGTEPGAS